MSFLVLFSALVSTISETIREKREERIALAEKRRYENIDWNNIKSVTFDGTETAYRIEEEEEFDAVMTNFLSEMDGWPHYETKTVQHEVEDGENYCFIIKYKDDTIIYRKFHETSPLTERLLEYCKKDNSDKLLGSLFDTIDAIDNTITRLEYRVGADSSLNCSPGDKSKTNALKTARKYLFNCSGFSRSRLLRQLVEYEKFPEEDAIYAVDYSCANWNDQALKSAKSYLSNCSGFSYLKLICQLQEGEEFTPEQAKYGVENSNANWNEQAVKRAKSYLDCFDYSRQRLIDQLKNEELFTEEQAEYAANVVYHKSNNDRNCNIYMI